jgi:hypothetical protein
MLDENLFSQAGSFISKGKELLQTILDTNSPDEIDRILGKGPFFRTQITK